MQKCHSNMKYQLTLYWTYTSAAFSIVTLTQVKFDNTIHVRNILPIPGQERKKKKYTKTKKSVTQLSGKDGVQTAAVAPQAKLS